MKDDIQISTRFFPFDSAAKRALKWNANLERERAYDMKGGIEEYSYLVKKTS